MAAHAPTGRPNQLFRNLNAKIASIPMMLVALVIFLGGTLWTVFYSFTNSRLLPRLNFVGLDQYERLWASSRWIISIQNLAIYGILSLIFSLVIGFLLAALMDQKIRFENALMNTGESSRIKPASATNSTPRPLSRATTAWSYASRLAKSL